ncbi:hypothetical protein ON010_g3127 [Phytophthora cinnamomi]|nr:hypothetical protein ON010_g3127 [Phytophthora cinnamomi]
MLPVQGRQHGGRAAAQVPVRQPGRRARGDGLPSGGDRGAGQGAAHAQLAAERAACGRRQGRAADLHGARHPPGLAHARVGGAGLRHAPDARERLGLPQVADGGAGYVDAVVQWGGSS